MKITISTIRQMLESIDTRLIKIIDNSDKEKIPNEKKYLLEQRNHLVSILQTYKKNPEKVIQLNK